MVSGKNLALAIIVALLIFGGLLAVFSVVFPDLFSGVGFLNPFNLGKQQHAVTVVMARSTLLSGLGAVGALITTPLDVILCADLHMSTFIDYPPGALPQENTGFIIPFTPGAKVYWIGKIYSSTGQVVTISGNGNYGCIGDAVLVWTESVWLSPGDYLLKVKASSQPFNFDTTAGISTSQVSFTIPEAS